MVLFRVYQSARTQSKLTLSRSFQCTSLKENHQFSTEKNKKTSSVYDCTVEDVE